MIKTLLNKEIDRERFYQMYLWLVNTINNKVILTEKEINVTAKLMSLDNGEKYFEYKPKDQYVEPINNCGYQETTRIKRKLLKLGLLKEEVNSDDKRKKNYTFTKKVNNLPHIFNFKLDIEWTKNEE